MVTSLKSRSSSSPFSIRATAFSVCSRLAPLGSHTSKLNWFLSAVGKSSCSTLVATNKRNSTFTPTQNGNYSVAVTNSVATKLTLYSDTILYNAGNNSIASKLNNNSSIFIYPNPAKSFSTLLFNADGKYVITVADITGRILQTKTGVAIKGKNIIQLDVSKYASGIYSITIADEKNRKQAVRLNKE